MELFQLQYSQYGSNGILIEWPDEIDVRILKDKVRFINLIKRHSVKLIVDIIPAYNSLIIIYGDSIDNFYSFKNQLLAIYFKTEETERSANFRWSVPVCYDAFFGVDMNEFTTQKKLSIDEVVALHSNTIYTVHFVGFLPGFLYLGGLRGELFLPRKSTPALNIKKGSVAIGGSQTGVYPLNSPGGWYVIGNSPINWFEPNDTNPCFAKAGDEIVFIPINRSDFKEIKQKVDLGRYQLEKTVLND
ncbi:5-oxoprolinase subunit PxpB [Spongiivirga sp. MCCC 1A20706]|uniref:5-oxoprolinase subunit PxpB n=1 Tax=Spongiivirga sp. MCCC 1A20706 TaxID=3160963 RepID=UPI00397790BB